MRNFFLLCCLCFAVVLQAQVKIGDNPQLLSPSAVLELESTNQPSNAGSDSGFGFGTSGGNLSKTTSCGYSEWNLGSSTNTLPGYVWLR